MTHVSRPEVPYMKKNREVQSSTNQTLKDKNEKRNYTKEYKIKNSN